MTLNTDDSATVETNERPCLVCGTLFDAKLDATTCDACETKLAKRGAYLDTLDELVAWLHEHPKFVDLAVENGNSVNVGAVAWSPERFAEVGLSLGNAEKFTTESFYSVVRHFGRHDVSVYAMRDKVCTKVETGETKQVEQRVGEDTRAIELVDEPVYEWKCPPSIGSLLGSES